VGVSSASALVAGVVDIKTGAGAADARVVVAGDQWLRRSAAGALRRGTHDCGVAALADRSDRPVRHDRDIALASAAGDAKSFLAGVTGAADGRPAADP
jgi:hypothetical protein